MQPNIPLTFSETKFVNVNWIISFENYFTNNLFQGRIMLPYKKGSSILFGYINKQMHDVYNSN